MKRHVHYETAFEDYLRSRGMPYVPVDEHKKAIFSGGRVKSFDFLVYHPDATWLVDVKGRKFPYEHRGRKRHWENWVTRDDINGLKSWQGAFGEGFVGMFVFSYVLEPGVERLPTVHIHPFRGQQYAFMCVSVDDYHHLARLRSPKWDTVSLPVKAFRSVAKPMQLIDGTGA